MKGQPGVDTVRTTLFIVVIMLTNCCLAVHLFQHAEHGRLDENRSAHVMAAIGALIVVEKLVPGASGSRTLSARYSSS